MEQFELIAFFALTLQHTGLQITGQAIDPTSLVIVYKKNPSYQPELSQDKCTDQIYGLKHHLFHFQPPSLYAKICSTLEKLAMTLCSADSVRGQLSPAWSPQRHNVYRHKQPTTRTALYIIYRVLVYNFVLLE